MKAVAVLVVVTFLSGGCGKSSGKIQSLQTELTQAQTQLATANGQITTLQSQLAVAHAKIAEMMPLVNKARTIPVRVTSLRPNSGTNMVYQIVNLSGSALAVRINLNNLTLKHSQSLTCVLPAARPAPPFEIGASESWPAAPGDVLEMTSEGYDILTKNF